MPEIYAKPKTPKVTVTVVTYNHGKWLAECLESLVTQTTTFPFEIVVGEDFSTDDATREILKKYAADFPHIIVPVYREKNIGASANYFDVVNRARGEYIAHVDGDDLAKPGKLQFLADFLDSNPECVMVGHQCEVIDYSGKRSGLFSGQRTRAKFGIDYLLANHSVFAHSSIMYRAHCKKDLIYDGNERLDLYVYMCIAKYGKIGYLDKVLGAYRRGVGIATKGYPKILQDEALERAIMSGASPTSIKAYNSNLLLHAAYASYKRRDLKNYLIFSARSLRLKIVTIKQFLFLSHALISFLLNTLSKSRH